MRLAMNDADAIRERKPSLADALMPPGTLLCCGAAALVATMNGHDAAAVTGFHTERSEPVRLEESP